MLLTLCAQKPEFKGRRLCTWHNQRDFIFFRQHRYIFEQSEKDGKVRGAALAHPATSQRPTFALATATPPLLRRSTCACRSWGPALRSSSSGCLHRPSTPDSGTMSGFTSVTRWTRLVAGSTSESAQHRTSTPAGARAIH